MGKEIINNKEIFSWIKSVILKYCPYSENRIDLVGSGQSYLEIDINLDNVESSVNFMFGTEDCRKGCPEHAIVNGNIDISEIISLIDFLIEDHSWVCGFNFQKNYDSIEKNAKELEMIFGISWGGNKVLKGLMVQKLSLNINFGKCHDLERRYLYTIINRYKTFIEDTKFYEEMKERYVDNYKEEYFKNMSKEKMLEFISYMNKEDIRKFLMSFDEDTLMDLISRINDDVVDCDDVSRQRLHD